MSYIFGGDLNKDDLVGVRTLNGVDFEVNGVGNGIRFILDSRTYEVTEDEDDGYRSSANAIVSSGEAMSNTFHPVQVFVSTEDDDQILVIQDAKTGDEIIRVGTENSDDYYPCFINSFNPIAMAINKEE